MSIAPKNYSSLSEFLEGNDIKMGEDFSMTPPLYHHSLEDALYQFFSTYNAIKDHFELLLQTNWSNRQSLSFNYSSNHFKEACVKSIFGFHHFFELYIKDILRRISSNLATNHFKKLEDVESFLRGNSYLPNPKQNGKTVEFKDACERFMLLKKLSTLNALQDIYNSAKQYFYLLTDEVQETLEQLNYWRNRISHNGNKVINYLALDYLVSQKIIPIIIEMYKVEKTTLQGYIPKYQRNAKKISLLEEMVRAKFNYNDFLDPLKKENMQGNLMYLAHLKELGRASFLSPMVLFSNSQHYENCNTEIRSKYEKFVSLEKNVKDYHNVNRCPCCDSNTLITYRTVLDDSFEGVGILEKYVSKCYTCTYEINSKNIDPSEIGLFDMPIHVSNTN